MQALDGKTYRLEPGMTVIADDGGPISLGGIMGGEATGVTEATTDVLLEVALFDPLRTAATGRRLGIESDARTRFERGLDPALVLPGAEHATRLILELVRRRAGAGRHRRRAAARRRSRSASAAARSQRLAGVAARGARDREPAAAPRLRCSRAARPSGR